MGNKNNQLIQCGFDGKNIETEAYHTREGPTANSGTPDKSAIDRNTKLFASGQHSNISSLNSNSISNPSIKPLSTSTNLYQEKSRGQKSTDIPVHENITKITMKPLPEYTKIPGSNLYRKQYAKCLDEIIESRYNTSMHFPENQMISLLEALVYSLSYMTKKGHYHHDYYPTNIFYQNGSFLVANPRTLQCSSYAITQQQKRFSFLSPQLIKQLLQDTREDQIPVEVKDKGDVFAIGMIMLQFCTLQPSCQCYDPEDYNIIDQIIQKRIAKSSGIYNPLISQCISIMLQFDVNKRIDPFSLSLMIHKQISEIRAIQANNEMSRIISENSRLSMSAKIVQRPPPGNYPPNLPQVPQIPPNMQQIPRTPQNFMQGTPSLQPIPNGYISNQRQVINNRTHSPRSKNLKPFEEIEEAENENDESPTKKYRQNNLDGLDKGFMHDPQTSKVNTYIYSSEKTIGSLTSKTNDLSPKKNSKYQNLDERIKQILENSRKYQ